MTEKVDRRIRRTQKLLAEALVALARKQGYDAVTIRDITEYADVSYSTFFRHYADKDALLMDMIQNTVVELRTLIGENRPSSDSGKVLFEHVADNQPLYRVLLGGHNSSAIVQRLQEIIFDIIMAFEANNADSTIPREIKANHVATAILALLKWWLDHDTPYSPERMGEIYAALILRPALGKA
ncbi:MAG: TetR family transcriptional regulator [Anaerolineaceae bacterium]|nr:TetR family transcriptional regulator [Anaerolineaceae bacterium]